MTIGEFAEAAARYRWRTGGSVASGGRTPERQALLDPSVPYSPHIFDVAADIVYGTDLSAPLKGAPPESVAIEIASRLGLKLIRDLARGHDHLQPLDWRAG